MIHVDETDPVGEIELSFPPRNVQIRRGVDAKQLYDLQEEIGRGKFGTVYRCKDRETGLRLAAKNIPVSRKEDRRNVEREIDIMRTLQHPRLIQLYDAIDSGKIMWVVLEYIDGGELFERVIDDDFVLTEKSCTCFMRQICEGIDFIHKHNILHLDMKPENILCLTRTGNRIKIIDFGLARRFDPDKKLQVLFGTPEFVAPEVVNFDRIGYATDMWSVGVICYVLLSGLSPFMGETDVETMANVTIAKYDFDDEAFGKISPEAKDFITKLLVKDKDFRMSAKECLQHPWLKKKEPLVPKLTMPKEINIPTNKKVATPGLEVTKDNLRLFVERWSEHPNSPYLFDVSCQIISPVQNGGLQMTSSQHSLGGMSPSPCGSLASSTESIPEILETSPDDNNVFTQYAFEEDPSRRISDELHFERRASDSCCFVKKTDISERVNLAEEIRKLSDKLFEISAMPDFTLSELHQSPKSNNNNFPNIPHKDNILEEINIPWRRKFRLTEKNRDVPLSPFKQVITESEQLNTNKTNEKWVQNGTNNALGTKNLLLKLLDKWDGTQEETKSINGRHKSISAEWSEVESLGQRTISSLNSFFQSRTTIKKTNPFLAADVK